jgi:hypothetical protein
MSGMLFDFRRMATMADLGGPSSLAGRGGFVLDRALPRRSRAQAARVDSLAFLSRLTSSSIMMPSRMPRHLEARRFPGFQ